MSLRSGISSIATNPLLRIDPQSSVMLQLTREALRKNTNTRKDCLCGQTDFYWYRTIRMIYGLPVCKIKKGTTSGRTRATSFKSSPFIPFCPNLLCVPECRIETIFSYVTATFGRGYARMKLLKEARVCLNAYTLAGATGVLITGSLASQPAGNRSF